MSQSQPQCRAEVTDQEFIEAIRAASEHASRAFNGLPCYDEISAETELQRCSISTRICQLKAEGRIRTHRSAYIGQNSGSIQTVELLEGDQ